jgi:hypothetical protein
MAGGSTSEEMDAFEDVTPAKPVSIYDLDEDLPTRMQTSDEIAEYQQKTRARREGAFKSFAPPTERRSSEPGAPATTSAGSTPSARPIPRESGPVLIDRMRVPSPAPALEAADEPDLSALVDDVAAALERLPPAPRVPVIEQPRGSLEVIPVLGATPSRRPRAPIRRRWTIALGLVVLLALAGVVAWLAHLHGG